MSALKRGYRTIADLRRSWANKVATANSDKATTIEHLQAAIEQKKKYQEEIFHMKTELESATAKLESTVSQKERIKKKKHVIIGSKGNVMVVSKN